MLTSASLYENAISDILLVAAFASLILLFISEATCFRVEATSIMESGGPNDLYCSAMELLMSILSLSNPLLMDFSNWSLIFWVRASSAVVGSEAVLFTPSMSAARAVRARVSLCGAVALYF